MNTLLTQFAQTEAASNDLFGALGIDWQMLLFQAIAFVILVWVAGKYLYPILIKTVDARQDAIEASTKAAAAAEQHASEATDKIAKLLKQARADAAEIVTTAKEEAAASLEASEAKSKAQAQRIVADAQAQLDKDVMAAKKALHNETLELVALATEKVVGKTVTAKVDDAVVSAALKEVL